MNLWRWWQPAFYEKQTQQRNKMPRSAKWGKKKIHCCCFFFSFIQKWRSFSCLTICCNLSLTFVEGFSCFICIIFLCNVYYLSRLCKISQRIAKLPKPGLWFGNFSKLFFNFKIYNLEIWEKMKLYLAPSPSCIYRFGGTFASGEIYCMQIQPIN